MLETLEKPNIKNLVLENPPASQDHLAGTGFEYFSDNLLERYQEQAFTVESYEFTSLLFMYPEQMKKIFANDPTKEILEKFLKADQDEVKESSSPLKTSVLYSDFINLSVTLKILFPYYKNPYFNEETWEGIKTSLEHEQSQGFASEYFENLVKLKILLPEKISEIEISDQSIANYKEQFKVYKDEFSDNDTVFLGYGKAFFADILNPNIDKELILNMRKEVSMSIDAYKKRPGNTAIASDAIYGALALKLLQAEEISVDSSGIHLIMPWDKMGRSNVPPYPEMDRT